MHGSTGQYPMYSPNVLHYASHGFIVVFPFVISPERDKNPLTTNTDGTYIMHGVDWARNATADPSSPVHGLVDMTRIISAGHSMGATCAIEAGRRLTEAGTPLVAVITQHPGICGPFGPPPWPSTWLKSELKYLADHVPLIFTTATNDGAFWPAPHTAEHELGCFNGAELNGTTSAFIQFTADACKEDGNRKPFPDGGHNCPSKRSEQGGPETPWVLTAAKLYAHMDGSASSACAARLWGSGAGSIAKDAAVEKLIRFQRPGATSGAPEPAAAARETAEAAGRCQAGSTALCSCSQLIAKRLIKSLDDCTQEAAIAACSSGACSD